MSVFSLNPTHPGLLDPAGQPFFTLGVNYEGYFDRAWAMWRSDLYDPELIDQDFAKARRCGFNCLRLFIQKENNTEVNRGNWRRLDAVLNLARKYGLAVMLTFNDEHSGTGLHCEIDRSAAMRFVASLGSELDMTPGG